MLGLVFGCEYDVRAHLLQLARISRDLLPRVRGEFEDGKVTRLFHDTAFAYQPQLDRQKFPMPYS